MQLRVTQGCTQEQKKKLRAMGGTLYSTVISRYLRGIHSKIRSGCPKLQVV